MKYQFVYLNVVTVVDLPINQLLNMIIELVDFPTITIFGDVSSSQTVTDFSFMVNPLRPRPKSGKFLMAAAWH